MGIGYLLGGLACLLYFGGVGYFGGIKRSPGILKLVKMKLGKNMSDDTAVRICQVAAIVIGAAGVVLLIIGGVQG